MKHHRKERAYMSTSCDLVAAACLTGPNAAGETVDSKECQELVDACEIDLARARSALVTSPTTVWPSATGYAPYPQSEMGFGSFSNWPLYTGVFSSRGAAEPRMRAWQDYLVLG